MSLSWEIGVDPPKQIGSGESGRVLWATLHSRKMELYHKAKQRSVPLCLSLLKLAALNITITIALMLMFLLGGSIF